MAARPRWSEVYVKKGREVGFDEGGNPVVMVDEEHVYALSPAAYYIWSMCDGNTTVGTIVEDIATSLGSEAGEMDRIYNAVVGIIDKLVEVGLAEMIPVQPKPSELGEELE